MLKLHEQFIILDPISFGSLVIDFYKENWKQLFIDEKSKLEQKSQLRL